MPTETELTADVCVIGGGPSGSTAAALLAMAGRSVVLFEKEAFPRFHIGESLLPFNMVLLERLGVLDQVEQRFVEKPGAHLVSSDGAITRDIWFAEGMVHGPGKAVQVLRSKFDELLLNNAEAKGARVLQQHAVVEAQTSHKDGCSVLARGPGGAQVRCRARFLFDASGRAGFVASKRGLRDMFPDLRKAAVFAHYEGVPRLEGRGSGSITLVMLKDGWFWLIPLPGDVMSVGIVAEGDVIKNARLAPEQFLDEAIRCCPAARARMTHAKRISQVWTESDYSYQCREIAGDGYLLLGDAAAFIDPLFSTGVWLGMSSAEMAADRLHRALGPDPRAAVLPPSLFADYEKKVRRHVRVYTQIVSRFYKPRFLDLFLQPGEFLRVKEAVISLLAGAIDPPLSMWWRLWVFYGLVRLQRLVQFQPPVPLLGVLEEPAESQGKVLSTSPGR